MWRSPGVSRERRWHCATVRWLSGRNGQVTALTKVKCPGDHGRASTRSILSTSDWIQLSGLEWSCQGGGFRLGELALTQLGWPLFAGFLILGARAMVHGLRSGRHPRTQVTIDQHRLVVDGRTWWHHDVVESTADHDLVRLRTGDGRVETFGPFVNPPSELRHLVGILERIRPTVVEDVSEARAREGLRRLSSSLRSSSQR